MTIEFMFNYSTLQNSMPGFTRNKWSNQHATGTDLILTFWRFEMRLEWSSLVDRLL
jgi:hypothetical protein